MPTGIRIPSMATAGALSSLGSHMHIGGKPLGSITVNDGFTANLGKAVVNNLTSATLNSALTGASLEDSIQTALVSAAISAGAGQVANSIGDLTPNNPTLKALAHALAGCVSGSAGQGGSAGCTAGAAGAVVGELAAQWYNPEGDLSRSAETLAFASLMAGVAGALATGDGDAASVNTAATTGANAALNNYLNHADIDKALKALERCEQSGQDCEPLRRQVAVHLNREHSEMTGQGSQIPVHRVERDCVLNGCAGILQDIDKGLATLQDPRARELLGDTVVQGLIERQLMDLSRVYDHHAAQGYTPAPELAWRAAKTLVELCAVVPAAIHCKTAATTITIGEAADKVTSGDVAGGVVQTVSAIGSARFAVAIRRNLEKTGVYSQGFLNWVENIYQHTTDKALTGVYEANNDSGSNSYKDAP